MATDKQLKALNELVYGVDHDYKKDGDSFKDVKEDKIYPVENQDFKVLSTSNTANSSTITL
ncbi:MAG: hypothetical protein L0I48_08920, partial [Lactococcus plantarum]|nr:hypothetical protein [Lactococcus plantarum]